MLEKMRESAHGTAAKTILTLVVLSFVLAGVGSYVSQGADNSPAVVNGEKITRYDFEKAYENQRNRMQQQFGEAFEQLTSNPEQLKAMRAGVLRGLVDERLLVQWIRDAGIRVSDEQVKEYILSIPDFQVDGAFNNDVYLSTIRRIGYSSAQFREMIRQDLEKAQVIDALSASDFMVDKLLEQQYMLENQNRDIRYVEISSGLFADQVAITDEQIEQFYNANLAQFEAPEQVDVAYIELRLSDLTASVAEPTDDEVQSYYTQHQGNYTGTESRRVAHILLSGDDAEQQAAELETALKEGAEFAELAKQHSADTFTAPQGGELPWTGKGVWEPEFEQAAFALAEGEVSAPVKTQYGVHIVKLLEVRPAAVKPLDDVRGQIIAQVKRDKAMEKYLDQQQRLSDAAYEVPDSLEPAATAAELTKQTTGLFTVNSAPALFNDPQLMKKVFDPVFIAEGMNSDVIELSPEHSIVVRVNQFKPSQIEPLEAVKDRVKGQLIAQESAILAEAFANELLQLEGEAFDQALSAHQLLLKSEAGLKRFAPAVNPAISQAAFELALPEQGQNSKVVDAGQGKWAYVTLDAVHQPVAPSADEIESMRSSASMYAERSQMNPIISALRAQADIVYPAAL